MLYKDAKIAIIAKSGHTEPKTNTLTPFMRPLVLQVLHLLQFGQHTLDQSGQVAASVNRSYHGWLFRLLAF